MKDKFDIAVIVGSLRKDSISRKLANAIVSLAPANLSLRFVDVGELPFYNPDLDADDAPQSWKAFRASMAPADGVLFVTPEYNRSVPASLKNALDVGSRPAGQSIWAGKPAGIVSGSLGGIGGFGANHHLRQSLTFLDMPAMQQPEAYIGSFGDLFDENGQITKDGTRDFLTKFASAFADWVKLQAKDQL
ncbi:NAD(P)H-dependent oxidoreductase [uncultured Cohaesibacter sp.]|uniref:NADPH-dependent FMN reductase n=1 Tax=uncultured Cohaesibacter sp. TaxID=1002546 RepID=UPI0029C88C6C|nr:NAD(P)H-dependent oxidoreductase [uncultured Cohaesibacter sp.]